MALYNFAVSKCYNEQLSVWYNITIRLQAYRQEDTTRQPR